MTELSAATAPPEPETPPSAPHRVELISEADGKDYTLRTKADVVGILRSLLQHGSLITAYFNQGNDFLLTSLLQISADGNALLFDVGSNPEMNRRALKCERVICVSNLDRVKIQFNLAHLDEGRFEGRPAFQAATPATLQRLQRRDFYRLVMPVLHPLKCIVPLKTYDGSTKSIEVNVIDISGGGVGLVVKSDTVELSSDMELGNCRIELPHVGTLVVDMRVRSVYEVTLRTGARHKRAGCQFIDLPNAMQMMLQRFIIKEERERKARESGLA